MPGATYSRSLLTVHASLIEELERDRKRLDWISAAGVSEQRGFYLGSDGLWRMVGDVGSFGKAKTLRDAIDAAIASSEAEGASHDHHGSQREGE